MFARAKKSRATPALSLDIKETEFFGCCKVKVNSCEQITRNGSRTGERVKILVTIANTVFYLFIRKKRRILVYELMRSNAISK